MLLHLCQQHVDMVAAVLLPVLKDGFTLIKEQQRIMDFGLPAYMHTTCQQCVLLSATPL